MKQLATRYERHLQNLRVPLGNSYLTPREYQIVVLLAEGNHPKEVASKIGRARQTVDGLIRNAMQRTGALTDCHLVAMLVASTYET